MLMLKNNLRYSLLLLMVFITHSSAVSTAPEDKQQTIKQTYSSDKNWFEHFKSTATDKQLYRFLYNMPKGGDLHHHSSGSNLPAWWYELALDKKKNGGYTYFTRTKTELCNGYGQNEFGFSPPSLTFHTISLSSYNKLTKCEQNNYKALNKLDKTEVEAWKNSIWLDKPHEGRDEFFQTHWQRLNDLTANPYIAAEMLVKNMKAFSKEGLIYLEAQYNVNYKSKVDGSPYTQEDALKILTDRLKKSDVKNTGVTLRLQFALLRFSPNAEKELESIYKFIDQHRDLYVGINMVGREDNPQGHPLRFLPTLRKLRNTYPAIELSIHAGESEAPNFNIRDSLLLGAKRIGHGVNLLDDPQTLLLMRHSQYLIEVNLISNLKLGYVSDFTEHPFPEFMRLGIPIALSTDDRGMWHSNMTDEFFVAVKHFNLSWDEIVTLSKNSIAFGFLDEKTKQDLLSTFDKNISKFESNFIKKSEKSLKNEPKLNQFILTHYPKVAN